uniref:Neur_chan_LBD domain-containing protein n=1 Tax=Heterorhabditis bacteriophora TaxID=37862 RepID=A0A1I7WEX5_HETBA
MRLLWSTYILIIMLASEIFSCHQKSPLHRTKEIMNHLKYEYNEIIIEIE